jgi:hypothetical protein
VQPDAVFPGACAAQAQGAADQLLVQGFGCGAFLRVVRVNQVTKVEITVAHMAY